MIRSNQGRCIFVPALFVVGRIWEQRDRGDRRQRSPGTHSVTAMSGVMIYV